MAQQSMQAWSRPPALASGLGLAGLLPQAAAVAVMAVGPARWHFSALALSYAYSALILSFLGGLWWGLAARQSDDPPAWAWLAAIAPSLIALATAVPWATGAPWPGPSLGVLGFSLLASLVVDGKLVAERRAPKWWMALRVPLSVGFGVLTLVAAAIG